MPAYQYVNNNLKIINKIDSATGGTNHAMPSGQQGPVKSKAIDKIFASPGRDHEIRC